MGEKMPELGSVVAAASRSAFVAAHHVAIWDHSKTYPASPPALHTLGLVPPSVNLRPGGRKGMDGWGWERRTEVVGGGVG